MRIKKSCCEAEMSAGWQIRALASVSRQFGDATEMFMNRMARMEGNGSKGSKPRLIAVQKNGLPKEISCNEPMEWSKVRSLTSKNLSKFIALLPQVSSAQSTTVLHKIRALSRRVELLLELFYAKPLPRHVHKLRRRIRKCRHVLGRLSDYDALLAIVARSMEGASPSQKAAWKSMEQYLISERGRRAPNILREVSELDFASPAARVKCDIDADEVSWREAGNGRAAKRANELAQERTRHVLGHLWNYFDSVLDESHQDPCEQSIHNVRIAVKRLRNVVSVMNKLRMAGASVHLAWLRGLQRAIGEWHDMEVLEHTMTGLLLRKKFLREHLELAVEVEQLLLQNREIKKKCEEGFGHMTRQSPEYEEMKMWARVLGAARQTPITVSATRGERASLDRQTTNAA